jgi:hypothetical protein
MTDPRGNPPQQPGTAITRAALERVLARAAELQGTTGDGDEAGRMTEAQIIELGKEVGLTPEVLRQALAEERSRTLVPEESGVLAGLMGPSRVSAGRTVPGSAAVVLGSLDSWMQRSEGLAVKRRFADQLVWEARRDFFSTFKRALSLAGSGLELAEAHDVSAIVAEVSPGQSHARIVADFGAARSRAVTTMVSLNVVMLIGVTVALLAINVQPALAVVPGALMAALTVFVSRARYANLVARAQVVLEQALDRLEFADSKPPTTAQVLLDAFIGTPRPPK